MKTYNFSKTKDLSTKKNIKIEKRSTEKLKNSLKYLYCVNKEAKFWYKSMEFCCRNHQLARFSSRKLPNRKVKFTFYPSKKF
jgi:hypothetical protein